MGSFSLDVDGFDIFSGVIPSFYILRIEEELLEVARHLANRPFLSLDEAWSYFRQHNRSLGGLLYNAFKRLPSVMSLASSPELLELIRREGRMTLPAIIDINCRIDSFGEDRFLFDWHQDYWFSVCSPHSLVAWIPLTSIDHNTGGLDLISHRHTQGRLYRTKPGQDYVTYADSVLLDEVIPLEGAQSIEGLCGPGDAVLFRFNTLHRSRPIMSSRHSRFTIQIRVADFCDKEFNQHAFKPNVISSS
ncbi:phytanoyl-CoA dioxygenase family protein [Pseudomonas guariconensis]|uniref:phytanoyl-CoA dioxygenase family protein n=1 Tax=Pseudomonas guariconensis TaxID=1288410 RepID=UPI0018A90118|nr:phytanoyl-CoA dioxygenase family protein [Pseudomonas guariconensis]MBF8756063.1 phytanoyl-CoA dioxygenase family protein [Pseudomonas guariconensis]